MALIERVGEADENLLSIMLAINDAHFNTKLADDNVMTEHSELTLAARSYLLPTFSARPLVWWIPWEGDQNSRNEAN